MVALISQSSLEHSSVLTSFLAKQSKRKKLVSTSAAYQKYDYPTLENQPESSISEAISFISIDDSSINLTRNKVPNNL